MLLELNSVVVCGVCLNVSNIIMGVSAEHFLRGKCGNGDITKRLIASFPGGAKCFLPLIKHKS